MVTGLVVGRRRRDIERHRDDEDQQQHEDRGPSDHRRPPWWWVEHKSWAKVIRPYPTTGPRRQTPLYGRRLSVRQYAASWTCASPISSERMPDGRRTAQVSRNWA